MITIWNFTELPKIFLLVTLKIQFVIFTHFFFLQYSHSPLNNQVPKSSFETDIPEDSYNATIDQQNLLYVQNQNTILYIYRHRINTIINNTRAVQARYRGMGLIRAPPAF